MSKVEFSDRGNSSTARRVPSIPVLAKKEMTMEEKINKMRGNQVNFKRVK